MWHHHRPSRRDNTIQHEARKQQMAKHGLSGMYWASTNPLNQGNGRKYGGMQHHQDQDAPRSGVRRILDLRTKSKHVWKCQNRGVPKMMKYFKTATDGMGTTSAPGNIQFLRTMLRMCALKEFDCIAIQFGSTTNGHLKHIKEGLISYPPLPSQLAQQT